MSEKTWDVFISYASEDKEAVVRPLVEALQRAAVKVWYDEHELEVGDSLSQKIDHGLAQSAYGVVVLSASFLSKHWPKKELSGLRALEGDGQKIILPVWHHVDHATVAAYSPTLADVVALNTNEGTYEVADRITKVVFSRRSNAPSRHSPSAARRFIELLESKPNRSRIVDFVKVHGGVSFYDSHLFEEYELLGTKFDSYAKYAGHHLQLSLLLFTDVCADPFTGTKDPIAIDSALLETLAGVREVKSRFAQDKQVQEHVKAQLLTGLHFDDAEYFRRYPVYLSFEVYAGRRKFIDRNPDTHRAWSRLRAETGYDPIWGTSSPVVVTYDRVVESLLRNESPFQQSTLW
jgi:hypothetical protein